VSGDPTTTSARRRLDTRLDDASGTGWAWDGSTAEVAWSVPGIRRHVGRPVFMVPDMDSLNVAVSVLKEDPKGAYDLVVAPVAWLASHRVQLESSVVVPAIVIALDLAIDEARGSELLSGWNPEGVQRVW
jgi:hypothetical protein